MLLALSLQTLTTTSVCVGSGSINIPVLCMLVSGDATMLEVQPLLPLLNDFHYLLILKNYALLIQKGETLVLYFFVSEWIFL